MSDEAAFLDAIAAAPGDDAVRRALADWLDARGRRGGELIRAECALAAAPFGSRRWHGAFAQYRSAGAGLPEEWCRAVGRYPLDHWLEVSARSAWARLERWHEKHRALFGVLSPGASAGEIEDVERTIGAPLPPDARASLATHNGSCDHFLLGDGLLSTYAIVLLWKGDRRNAGSEKGLRRAAESFPSTAVAPGHFNPGWVPLASDLNGRSLGVDLAPGPAGTVGQVINFGTREPCKCVLAPGWGEFLADYATFLESGAVGTSGPNATDPCAWYTDAFDGHCHDALCQWRWEGRWPPRDPA